MLNAHFPGATVPAMVVPASGVRSDRSTVVPQDTNFPPAPPTAPPMMMPVLESVMSGRLRAGGVGRVCGKGWIFTGGGASCGFGFGGFLAATKAAPAPHDREKVTGPTSALTLISFPLLNYHLPHNS